MQTNFNGIILQVFNEWLYDNDIKDIYLYDPIGLGQICFYVMGVSGGLAAKVICYPIKETDSGTYSAPFEINQDIKNINEVISQKFDKVLIDFRDQTKNCRKVNLNGGDLGREIRA